MSSPIATSAGSLGGAQPPSGPSTLLSHYESDTLQPNYKYIKFIQSILDN